MEVVRALARALATEETLARALVTEATLAPALDTEETLAPALATEETLAPARALATEAALAMEPVRGSATLVTLALLLSALPALTPARSLGWLPATLNASTLRSSSSRAVGVHPWARDRTARLSTVLGMSDVSRDVALFTLAPPVSSARAMARAALPFEDTII